MKLQILALASALLASCVLQVAPSSSISSAHWANPAFSGTIEQINLLEQTHASAAKWRDHAQSERIIRSDAELTKIVGVNPARFAILHDEALELLPKSSSARLFQFPGLYFVLVFFDDTGCSTVVARHI
jgi:hypothetical protein